MKVKLINVFSDWLERLIEALFLCFAWLFIMGMFGICFWFVSKVFILLLS